MSLGKPKAPGIPDYQSLAQKQQDLNMQGYQQTARMNNPTINTAFGHQTTTFDANGNPTVNQTLNPDVQNLYQKQLDYAKGINIPGIDTQGNLAGRDLVTQTLLDRQQPLLDRQRQLAENNLLIQGHNRGGEAFNAAENDLARQENDARMSAILAGGQEQSRLAGLQGQQQQQAIGNLQSLTNPSLPQFYGYQSPGQAPVTDILGAAQNTYQANLNEYLSKLNSSNNAMSGLFGLGGAALMGGGGMGGLFGLGASALSGVGGALGGAGAGGAAMALI